LIVASPGLFVKNFTFMLPPSDSPPSVSAILILGAGVMAISTASIFIKFALVEAPSLSIAAYRLAIASIVLAPITFWRYRGQLVRLKPIDFILALAAGVLLAGHFAAWIASFEYTSVASSIVLVTTVPLWVALFSPWLLKEPLARAAIYGLILVILGAALVGLSDTCTLRSAANDCLRPGPTNQSQALRGNLLSLTGALTGAGYLIIGRGLRARLTTIPYIFLVYSIAALFLVSALLLSGAQAAGFSPQTYLWFVLLALIPQLIGHSSFNWALGYLPANIVSIAFLGEPVGAILLAYLFLAERPSALKLFGAILILTGIYVASTRKTNPLVERFD